MKPMSDKELDQLFKSQFEDFEIEPSKESWNKIEQEIDMSPKRRSPIFWLAAASAVIILGFGLQLFIQPTEKIKLYKNEAQDVAGFKESKHVKDKIVSDDVDGAIEYSRNSNNTKTSRNDNRGVSNRDFENNTLADATLISNDNVLEESRNVTEIETYTVKPAKRKVTVSEQILADEEKIIKEQNLITQQALLTNNNVEETNSDSKTKIRSVGDLVNFVIAKVDKREEKIIYISKTEESDLEITGINLGLFKYRKD